MCATCGCGDSDGVRLSDPTTGRVESLDDPRLPAGDASQGHEHGLGHHHPHDHSHGGPPHHHDPVASTKTVSVERRLLAHNDLHAERNRGWFSGRGVVALNVIGSPGSGKTRLLEASLTWSEGVPPLWVIEGDSSTDRDARRIQAAGGRAVQVTTGTVCHLDAAMVDRAVRCLDPAAGGLVVVENVGNLVCPALFDLGETFRVVVLSTPEGDDKPLKYPHVFRSSHVLVITKLDLADHVDFDRARCADHARSVNPGLQIFWTSARTGEGMSGWCQWLRRLPVDALLSPPGRPR